MNQLTTNKSLLINTFIVILVLLFTTTGWSVPYMVYPVNGYPFEADTVYYRGDSVAVSGGLGDFAFAWSQLLDVVQPDGKSLPRPDIMPMPGNKAVVTAPGMAAVRMEYRSIRPYEYLALPGLIVVAGGVYEAILSKKHFDLATKLENEGNDPSRERKLGQQQRTIGLAVAFVGAATLVVALTPRKVMTPVFAYTPTTGWKIGISYEISLLGILD